MPGHDIVVIGASAGGLKALNAVFSELPGELPAACFVVQHIVPDRPSLLPRLLGDVTDLSVKHPAPGEEIRPGHVYVAPPDHHLLLEPGRVLVVRGPEENRYRPSIDALFRSAARAYGPRVIGVVLTGLLDDGTVGLQAIKKRGGITIIQDPKEAEHPSMPSTALRFARIDYSAPVRGIATLLKRLVFEPAEEATQFPVPLTMEVESSIAEQDLNTQELLDGVQRIGERSGYTCPTCSGTTWLVHDDGPKRFRCHVGHSFLARVFVEAQAEKLEQALWSAVRLMEERATLVRQLAGWDREQQRLSAARRHEKHALEIDQDVNLLRQLIMFGDASRRTAVAEAESGLVSEPERPAEPAGESSYPDSEEASRR